MKIVETVSGSVTSTKQFVWCSARRCEVRDGSSNLINQYFESGQVNVSGGISVNYYYALDHLGSVREVTDSSGSMQSQFSYDPYGIETEITGSGAVPDIGYAGYFKHARSGLLLTVSREYSPVLGRFVNRDPVEEFGGLNLYGYSYNNPIQMRDPLGFCAKPKRPPIAPYDPKGPAPMYNPTVPQPLGVCSNFACSKNGGIVLGPERVGEPRVGDVVLYQDSSNRDVHVAVVQQVTNGLVTLVLGDNGGFPLTTSQPLDERLMPGLTVKGVYEPPPVTNPDEARLYDSYGYKDSYDRSKNPAGLRVIDSGYQWRPVMMP